MVWLVAGLLVVIGAPVAAQPHAASDDSALVKRVRGAAHGLMRAWRTEWMRGYKDRSGSSLREAAGHCHFDGGDRRQPVNLVPSTTRKSMCPTWYASPDLTRDERYGIDAALREEARDKIRARRASLLALLDTAVAIMPGNPELHGHRVRFAVDQRDSAGARQALEDCRGPEGWCGLIAVYVAARFGALSAADSLLDVALKQVAPSKLCEWTDVAPLLDASDRKVYERLRCDEKLKLERTLWWLADPFWSVSRNERRAEHFARVVEVMLRSGLETDERFDWRRDKGGTSVSHMVVRYGWPSFVGWLGHAEDNAHRSWLGFDDGAVATPAPEYTAPRAHLVPRWSVVASPSSLSRDEWRDMSPRWSPPRNRWDLRWWAQEHMKVGAAPIVGLPDQTALFRRARSGVVAVATQMSDPTKRTALAVPYIASLVVAVEPELSVTVDTPVPSGNRVALAAPVMEPSIVSIELLPRNDTAATMGRARYGITPLPSLAKLPHDEIALSDLALFEAGNEAAGPASVNELLALMLPSATVQRGARLGVFWETYGLRSGDTANVKIRVQREDRGMLRGIAALAGFARDEKDAVEISWTEPQAGLTGRAFDEAGTPVQTRSITLGLAALDPGRYTITLTVAPLRAPAAVSVRPLEIR